MVEDIHRYMRCHKELMEDEIGKRVYTFARGVTIEYWCKGNKNADKEQTGKFIDFLFDRQSENCPIMAERGKTAYEHLYNFYSRYPECPTIIRA